MGKQGQADELKCEPAWRTKTNVQYAVKELSFMDFWLTFFLKGYIFYVANSSFTKDIKCSFMNIINYFD